MSELQNLDAGLKLLDQEEAQGDQTLMPDLGTPTPDSKEAQALENGLRLLDQESTARLRAGAQKAAEEGGGDQAAEVLNISNRTGVDRDLVNNNIEEVRAGEQRDKINSEIQRLRTQSPGTAAWMESDEYKAAMAADDTSVLSIVEQSLTAVSDVARELPAKFLSTFGMGLSGYRDMQKSLAQLPGLNFLYYLSGSEFVQERPAIDIGGAITEGGGAALEKAGEVIGAPKERQNFATEVSGAIGTMASFIVANIVNPTASLAMMSTVGAEETSDLIDRTIKKKNLDVSEENRAYATLLGGLATAAAERMGLEAILKGVPIPKQLQLKNSLARWLVDKTLVGGVEATEEAVEALARDWAVKTFVDEERKLLEDFTAREAGVAFTAAALVRMVTGAKRFQAEQNVEEVRNTVEAARESALRQRSPESFKDYLTALVGETDRETIIVSAQPLVEALQEAGANPGEVLAGFGVDMRALESAVESGGNISIAASEFYTTVQETEHLETMLSHVRTNEGARTLAEAIDEEEQVGARADEILFQRQLEQTGGVTEQTATGDQVVVYNPDGSETIAEVVAVSDAGGVIVKTEDGEEHLLGESMLDSVSARDPAYRTSLLQDEQGQDREISKLTDEELEAFIQRSEELVSIHKAEGATAARLALHTRDRNAGVFERKRRAGESVTFNQPGVQAEQVIDPTTKAVREVGERITANAVSAGYNQSAARKLGAVWEAQIENYAAAYRAEGKELTAERIAEIFGIDMRRVKFSERDAPTAPDLEQTLQEQRQRFRDTLSDDVLDKVVAAANTELTQQIELGVGRPIFDKFNIDQIIQDELQIGEVNEDGYAIFANFQPEDVNIPADAVAGDRIPLSAVAPGSTYTLPTGQFLDNDLTDLAEDFELEISQLDRNPDGTIDPEETFVEIAAKDFDALERKYADQQIAEGQVDTIEDALNHEDHQARAAAFGVLLDELGINYTTDGSGVASFYYYVGSGRYSAELDEYLDDIKIRFADHENQSRYHPSADFNVADEGYDTAIDAINFILRERGMMEADESFQTVDTSDANILHQTITDATGKPLAVVHNISVSKLRHAFKMGGLPVPSLAIIDAQQRFDKFGEIQLVGSPSLVDPRQSRRNRVFDADVYSPRYPSGDIERTIDDDAADAAQAELDAIGEEIGEGAYRPGWLRGELSDSGVKFLARERPIQVAFLRSIGVEQRIEATADAIEGREGEFNQFIEDTYGALITKERILDQITDTGRSYLPHNLDNVVRIMKRDLRGGERFNYGVGSIRAQTAKQFRSLKDIKDARDRIVSEPDMQAFKDDTDDAFGALASELQPFYSGDRNQFGFLDVVVDMLSDYARRGERAADDYGFENVSDEAKQSIVNFLANLRMAPTEYFEAKIQRAVEIDEFQGAIVTPETPQDIRNLLEESGLRVIESTDRSKALLESFSDELFQSAVPIQRRPLKIKGTGPHGRITNWDFAERLTDRHMQKYGRTLDPGDPSDMRIIVNALDREYKNQLAEQDSGDGWYVEDIASAINISKSIIPELGDTRTSNIQPGEQTLNRDAFLTMAALLSPQQKPRGNWENAIQAFQGFLKTGRIPLTKENGTNWGVPGQTTGLQLFQHLIDQMGLEAAVLWLRTPHTGREIAQMRKDSGLFKDKPTLAGYTASETNLSNEYLGIYMMGPKVGDFMLNATGFDQSAVTVDLWMIRTYNRLIGRLLDVPASQEKAKEIKSEVRGVTERGYVKEIVRQLAEKNGVDPSAMQAGLWYFEQRLYRNHGINSESENFAGAAIAAAEKRSISLPRTGEDAQTARTSPSGELLEDDTLYQLDQDTGLDLLKSRAQRVVRETPQKKMPGSEWSAYLQKRVKKDELDTIVGLEEFLKSQTKAIDKSDLLSFIRQNGIALSEVIRDDDAVTSVQIPEVSIQINDDFLDEDELSEMAVDSLYEDREHLEDLLELVLFQNGDEDVTETRVKEIIETMAEEGRDILDPDDSPYAEALIKKAEQIIRINPEESAVLRIVELYDDNDSSDRLYTLVGRNGLYEFENDPEISVSDEFAETWSFLLSQTFGSVEEASNALHAAIFDAQEAELGGQLEDVDGPTVFGQYIMAGERHANKEFYLTLPERLSKGNSVIEDWLVPSFHQIQDWSADNRLVVRIRATGRTTQVEPEKAVIRIPEFGALGEIEVPNFLDKSMTYTVEENMAELFRAGMFEVRQRVLNPLMDGYGTPGQVLKSFDEKDEAEALVVNLNSRVWAEELAQKIFVQDDAFWGDMSRRQRYSDLNRRISIMQNYNAGELTASEQDTISEKLLQISKPIQDAVLQPDLAPEADTSVVPLKRNVLFLEEIQDDRYQEARREGVQTGIDEELSEGDVSIIINNVVPHIRHAMQDVSESNEDLEILRLTSDEIIDHVTSGLTLGIDHHLQNWLSRRYGANEENPVPWLGLSVARSKSTGIVFFEQQHTPPDFATSDEQRFEIQDTLEENMRVKANENFNILKRNVEGLINETIDTPGDFSQFDPEKYMREMMAKPVPEARAQFNRLGEKLHRSGFDMFIQGQLDDIFHKKDQTYKVPPRPFLDQNKSVELALKRMLIEAAESGYSGLSWTPADVQIERWDAIETLAPDFDPNSSRGRIKNRVRSGHTNFYDQLVRNNAKEIAKKLGTKLEVIKLDGGRNARLINETKRTFTANPDQIDAFMIPITPEMRSQIQEKGLELFQDPDDPKGAYSASQKLISLFENADPSTLLHESGHAFVSFQEQLVRAGDAPQRVVDNYNAMLQWVGARNADDLNVNMNGDAAREKQERLARAFERYLREGKAPSVRLRDAFSEFSAWLKSVYRTALDLNVEIDDEIRGIFDRMLATDAEIAEMKSVNNFDLGSSPTIQSLMSDAERGQHEVLTRRASEQAANEYARAQQEMEARVKSEWWLDELERRKQEAEELIYERPEYRAFFFLTRGEFRTGETPPNIADRRISKSALLELGYSQEDLNALPRFKRRIYTNDQETATDPVLMAGLLGFDSVNEMIDTLTRMRPPQAAIDFEAGVMMRSEHGDPINDGTIERLTEERLYNDDQRAAIEMELDALATATGQQGVGRKVVKAIVDRIFDEQNVGELLTPMKFQAASVRAAKEAERAALKGDNALAFKKKREHLLNHELFRRALQARDDVQKINKRLSGIQRRKFNTKTVAAEYVTQVKAVLSFYEFGKRSPSGRVDPSIARSIIDFVEARAANNQPVILPGDLVELVGLDPETGNPQYALKTKHWREMTMSELRALRDLSENLLKVGRDNSKSAAAERRQRGEDLADHILSNSRRRPGKESDLAIPTHEEQKKQAGRGRVWASHRKFESMLRELDGFKDIGKMWTAVFEGLAKAQDRKTVMTEEVMKKFEGIIGQYDWSTRKHMRSEDGKHGTPIQALGGALFSHEQRLTLALNWGNESSREAVLEDRMMLNRFGQAWNEEAIQEILNTLDATDVNVIQQIWALVDSYWEDINLSNGDVMKGIKNLERASTGIAPPKIEASEFTINGQTIAGGYYPLMYNPFSDAKVRRESEEDLKNRIQSGGFARAHTTHGFTIARVGSGGRAVRYDIGVLYRHLDEVTQDLAYREAVNQATEVIGNPDVQNAITEVMGTKYLKAMEDILIQTANGNLAQKDGWTDLGVLTTARLNTTTAIMGVNLRSILTQPFGLMQSWHRLGFKDVAKGVLWFWSNPVRTGAKVRHIHSKSTYMAERSRMLTRELDDIVNKIDARGFSDKVREAGFKPMVWMDVIAVAYPTWQAAYEKAMAGKVDGIAEADEAKAIKFADSTVRTTQGSGGAQNLSMIQQSSELSKLMTMFYGYFNTTFNLQAEVWREARAQGKSVTGAAFDPAVMGHTIILQILPAILSGLLLERWPDEEEEDESWIKWSLLQLFNYSTGQIVGVRDVGSAISSGFDVSLSPVTSIGTGIGGLLRSSWKAGEDMLEGDYEFEVSPNFVKKGVRVIGAAIGVPGSNQLARTADYLWKYSQDELKREPRNVAEFAQGVLFTGDRR